MHLSLLSDCFVSDSLNDSASARFATECDFGAEDHLKGVLRGVVFAAALLVPLALTVVSAWLFQTADVGSRASEVPSAQKGWVAGED